MNLSKYFDPRENTLLIGYKEKFDFFVNLILQKKLPQVILLSGEKGIGKTTFVCHLMHYLFDPKNYDIKSNCILKKGSFSKLFLQNLHSNIFFLTGSDFKNIGIDDIRKLKNNLQKSTFSGSRFIIFENIDLFNSNSLNGLLKIIEEPNPNNYFILIYNKSKILLETVKSRCLEIKLQLKEKYRQKAIETLINQYDQNIILDTELINISPGNFLKFNFFFKEARLDLNDSYNNNLKKILNFYKKEKDLFYQDLLLFYTEYNLQFKKTNNYTYDEKFIENRNFLINNINNFFLYNLNQNTLINSIEAKLNE